MSDMRDKTTDRSDIRHETTIYLTAETSNAILAKLRHAVAFQIGLGMPR
jgi:hypothetical protein